ncbi:MAG: hypothetical protein AAF658_14040 [Myxococcota bacterium]
MFGKLAYVAVVVAVSSLSQGCDDSCRDLSEQICQCESTQTSQSACLQRLDQREGAVVVGTEDLERCNALIDTCTCDALANGDYAACGLSVE